MKNELPKPVQEAVDLARYQMKPFLIALVILIMVFLASSFIHDGFVTYLLTVPALIIIVITAYARVNDIGPDKIGIRWELRKIGLILAGMGAVTILTAPFSTGAFYPTWRGLVLIWGFSLTWLTTPEMPPWWDYITGKKGFRR